MTAAVLAVGTMLVGAYLRRYASSSLAGATGSVFFVLLWIYYVAQIVLVGAELTRVLARWHADDGGSRRCTQPPEIGRPASAQATMPPSTSTADSKPSSSMIASV